MTFEPSKSEVKIALLFLIIMTQQSMLPFNNGQQLETLRRIRSPKVQYLGRGESGVKVSERKM